MNYEINKTRFKHRLWGEGILRKVEGTIFTIEFPRYGYKTLMEDSLLNGVLTVTNQEILVELPNIDIVKNNNSSLRQYDTAKTIVGGKNILEAFESEDILIFNESYTIVGTKLSAKKISATYDLTIIGDVCVDEIKVNGGLIVVGNISANKIVCEKTLICKGNVDVDYLYVGSIIAKSVKCIEIICDENALIETTVDIGKSSKIEKNMFACEGVMGEGDFTALNAIVNDYFEFFGDIKGNILELSTNTKLSEVEDNIQIRNNISSATIEEVILQVENRLQDEYKKCSALEEDSLAELINLLTNNSLHNLGDYADIFDKLTNISYKNELDNFSDYLTVIYAKSVLPEEIYRYETIEHIDTIMLPRAEGVLDELEFIPQSVEHIAQCIQIVIKCADIIPIGVNVALDKIFSSFGIRYLTVKNILEKTSAFVPDKKSITNEVVTATVTDLGSSVVDVDINKMPNKRKFNMSKSKFLNMSIQAEAKFFGITVEEQVRLASARIKTCGEFLRMSEQDLKALFKKKLFLANHLYQAQQKMKAAFDEMDED